MRNVYEHTTLDRCTAPTAIARVADRVARCMSVLSGVLAADDAGEFVCD